jgi:DNA-binding GntR family transcriptional regulator
MENKSPLDWAGPVASNALRHDVVVRLMAGIFQGTLPADSRLNIRKMAEQMGVSATPIREALVELEGIGLVQFFHNRGAVVKPFGCQQLRDIYHVRRLLDSEAARCACGKIPREELQSLRREMRRLLDSGDQSSEWLQEAIASDRRLHDLVAAHCGNDRLADEVGRYNTIMQTVREIVGNRRHAQQVALKDHMAVVNALLAGDAERAADAMRRHIDGTVNLVEAVMFPKR